jgi:hypothetical protein
MERLVPTASSSSESEEGAGSRRRSSAGTGGRRRRWCGWDHAESHGYGDEVERGLAERRRWRRRGGWQRWVAREEAMAAVEEVWRRERTGFRGVRIIFLSDWWLLSPSDRKGTARVDFELIFKIEMTFKIK